MRAEPGWGGDGRGLGLYNLLQLFGRIMVAFHPDLTYNGFVGRGNGFPARDGWRCIMVRRIGETRYLATRPDGRTMEFNSMHEAMDWANGNED